MIKTLSAIFDGEVLRPDAPIELKANTRVRLTIEELDSLEQEPQSFLRIARELELQGPADWSEKLDDYLYGAQGNGR